MKNKNMEWEMVMRQDVSHQQSTDRADEALRTLVRLLARAAAREALVTAPKNKSEKQSSTLRGDGSNHVE